jgi:Flp pilus assembly protein protease CpaA
MLEIPIELIIAIFVSLIGLIVGSITDLKKREVADYVNYSLMFIGFSIALITSIAKNNYLIFLYSVFGFTFFFIIGYIMFYTGQWGGGDSKMLMGLGSLLGLTIIFPLKDNFYYWIIEPPLIIIFLIITLFVGAFYGIFWSIGLAIINRKEFIKEFKRLLKQKKMKIIKIICLVVMVVLFSSSFIPKLIEIKIILMIFSIFFPLLFYLWVFVKAIEKTAMIKKISPEKLTEGDWISKEIKIGKKIIASPKDLGASKEQIKKLIKLYNEKKITFVEIKEGIPFVPSFLISFVISLFVYFKYFF